MPVGTGGLDLGAIGSPVFVSGPGVAVIDNSLPRWDTTSGILLQGSGIIVDDSDNMLIPTLTVSRLVGTSASNTLQSENLASWVAGTANRVTVADDGDGSVTLSTPQDIHTGATPTFASMIVSEDGYVGIGAAAERIVFDGTGGALEVMGATFAIGTVSPSTFGNPDLLIVGSSPRFTISDGSVGAFISISQESNEARIARDNGDSLLVGSRISATAAFVEHWRTDTSGNILMAGVRKVMVRDPNIYINSGADSFMDLVADGGVRIGDGGTTNYSMFEPDGTLVFHGAATVWEDINFSAGQGQNPASSSPGIVTFTDNLGADTDIATRGFAVGEHLSYVTEEIHAAKEGADIYFHVHAQYDAAPSGTDYVKWQISYTITRDGVTCAPVTTIVVESAIDTQYEQVRSNFAAVSGTGLQIGDQIKCVLERVAAVGDAYAGEAKLVTFGIHVEKDTVGSRTIHGK